MTKYPVFLNIQIAPCFLTDRKNGRAGKEGYEFVGKDTMLLYLCIGRGTVGKSVVRLFMATRVEWKNVPSHDCAGIDPVFKNRAPNYRGGRLIEPVLPYRIADVRSLRIARPDMESLAGERLNPAAHKYPFRHHGDTGELRPLIPRCLADEEKAGFPFSFAKEPDKIFPPHPGRLGRHIIIGIMVAPRIEHRPCGHLDLREAFYEFKNLL